MRRAPLHAPNRSGCLVGLRRRGVCVLRAAGCFDRYQCYGGAQQKRDHDVKDAAEGFFSRCEHDDFLKKNRVGRAWLRCDPFSRAVMRTDIRRNDGITGVPDARTRPLS